MRQCLRFPKWATRSRNHTVKPRRSRLGFSPYRRRLICEMLEDRRLLSITLTNGLDPTSPDYFAVVLDGGGSTRQTSLAGADTIYDYCGYLDIGTTVFNLGDYATSPVQNGTGKAVSDVSITPPGGGHVGIRVTSEIPSGAKVMVNTYDFTSQGFDLRNAKFFQYMDSDIYSVGDDVLTVSGSIASNNLVLTTIDPATSIRQAQTPGVTSGALLSGFGADEYPELRSLIESGDFAPPAPGQIDTSSIPPGTFPGIGPGYGPEDITTALSYDFTAVGSATISTNLGLRDLTTHFPHISVEISLNFPGGGRR